MDVGATVRNLRGGVMDALTALAIVLTLGLLAFSSLGASAASVGIPAAMAGVVVGGLVFAALAGSAVPTAGPTSATTLIVASLVATLVADPEARVADPAGLAAVLALCGVAVVLAGVFQILFAAAGAHRLARRVPQPVLAGFMNGVALLILLAQVPPLLGLPPVSKWSALDESGPVQPLAAVLGGLTALAIWASTRWRPRWPAPLLGLAVGVLAYWAMDALAAGVSLGPVVGTLRESYPWPDTLLPFLDAPNRNLLARHAPAVVTTALAIAVIGGLESLRSAVAIDQLSHGRHDSRRELIALGLANLGSGVVGGLPVVLTRARALLLLDQGIRGRAAPMWSAGVFLALQAFGTGLIALLPKAALAGVMLVIALALVDRWTRQLFGRWRSGDRSPELRVSLGVVLVVCAITLLAGFPAAIVAGTLLSLALFVRGMSRSLVRSRRTAVDQPSRRVYAPAQEARLAALRGRILILELEAALFFGSVERLAAEADTLPPEIRILVLDLRRLTMIDESGAVLLEQLTRRLPQRGTRLYLASVKGGSGHAVSLARFAAFPAGAQDDWFADADRAVEAGERVLLAEAATTSLDDRMALEDTSLLASLEPARRACLERMLSRRDLGAGETLFREGDPGDALYVLTRGSVSIVGADGHRYVSHSPGAMFGETAMLDGHGRSASAVADIDSEVHALARADFDRLQAESPELAAEVLRSVALHLAGRLRIASMAWQASAR